MIVSHNKLLNVQDISARDAIEIKTRGLRVQVADASSDDRTSGSAIYSWNGVSWDLENQDNEIPNNVINKLQSDDTNLDTFQEIIDYIKNLKQEVNDLKTFKDSFNIQDFVTAIN